MKLNMDLIREILLEIEKQYVSTAIYNLNIDGYDMETVAYHCKMLHEEGLISDYKALYADDEIDAFGVGPLTMAGNKYLNNIRDNSIWKKTKDTIKEKGLPIVLSTIRTVSTALITAAAEGVANSIFKNGGQG